MSKVSKIWGKIEREISNIIPHEHSRDRRAANEMMREQMEFYKNQREQMEKQSQQIEAERSKERDRLQKKQIQSLRRNYRAPGFLDETDFSLSQTSG